MEPHPVCSPSWLWGGLLFWEGDGGTRTREIQPTVGATDGVGSSKELQVRAVHRAQCLWCGPGWMVMQERGVSQAFSTYRLRLFPSEDSQDLGLLQGCCSKCPRHGTIPMNHID